jgi:hypothetical protein
MTNVQEIEEAIYQRKEKVPKRSKSARESAQNQAPLVVESLTVDPQSLASEYVRLATRHVPAQLSSFRTLSSKSTLYAVLGFD